MKGIERFRKRENTFLPNDVTGNIQASCKLYKFDLSRKTLSIIGVFLLLEYSRKITLRNTVGMSSYDCLIYPPNFPFSVYIRHVSRSSTLSVFQICVWDSTLLSDMSFIFSLKSWFISFCFQHFARNFSIMHLHLDVPFQLYVLFGNFAFMTFANIGRLFFRFYIQVTSDLSLLIKICLPCKWRWQFLRVMATTSNSFLVLQYESSCLFKDLLMYAMACSRPSVCCDITTPREWLLVSVSKINWQA